MMDKEGAKIAQKIYNKLSRIRTERDNYRAVLEGAGYRDLDLLKKETRDCRQIGIEAQKRTQKIIDERNELRAEVDRVATEGGALIIELEAEVGELKAERDELREARESEQETEDDYLKEIAELRAQLEAVRDIHDEMAHNGTEYMTHQRGDDLTISLFISFTDNLRWAILQPDSGKDGG